LLGKKKYGEASENAVASILSAMAGYRQGREGTGKEKPRRDPKIRGNRRLRIQGGIDGIGRTGLAGTSIAGFIEHACKTAR
jgi:hypothetical protein